MRKFGLETKSFRFLYRNYQFKIPIQILESKLYLAKAVSNKLRKNNIEDVTDWNKLNLEIKETIDQEFVTKADDAYSYSLSFKNFL